VLVDQHPSLDGHDGDAESRHFRSEVV